MKHFLIFLLIISSQFLFAQKEKTDIENHEHDPHFKEAELGIALGAAFINEEKEIKPSIHFHLVSNLEKIEWLNLGIGFESMLDKHVHINPTFVVNYKIYDHITLGSSPGILFLKEDGTWKQTFSIHFEILYHIDFRGLHLEPLLEYSYSNIDSHFLVGIHFGFGI